MEGIFVTGTDTDVGKTTICGGLLKLMFGARTVRYWKPVQTGTVVGDDTNDLKMLTELNAETFMDPAYRFPEPISPHFAAKKWGKTIDLNAMVESFHQKKEKDAFYVVEGSGGLMMPLNDDALLINLIQALGFPLILIAEDRVGAINQVLLSLRAARDMKIPILGVILTKTRGGFGNAESIAHFGKVEVLAEFPPTEDARMTVAQVIGESAFAKAVRFAAHAGVKLPDLEAAPVWHPFTAVPHLGPRHRLSRAEGAFVWDSDGKRYFDATSSWWSNIHGHGHPRLVEAIRKQAASLDHVMMAPHAHDVGYEFAARLLDKLGPPFAKVFFSDNGSTAVEAALKMALQFWHAGGEPNRNRFLSLDLAYHGDTLGALSVGHISEFQRCFDTVKIPVFKSTAPYCYRCPLGLEYPSCKIACTAAARAIIEERGDEIAAFIVEPLVLGAAGMVPYPPEYLRTLVSLCREKGILVIFDEVFTGFGRTGSFFAMEQVFENSDLRPDMVCLSKGLTAGMLPMAATVTTQEIFQRFTGGEHRKLFHGHTFSGNPIGCALGIESLKLFDEQNLIEKNRALAKIMAEEIPKFRDLEVVGDARQLGMIWALELVRDRKSKKTFEPANGPGWKIASAMWERGIWIRPLGAVVYLIPPYCSGESDLQAFFKVLYSELQSKQHFV